MDLTFNKSLVWKRIIFDEADTLNLPNSKQPISIFTWIVTSSITNLLFPSGFYWKYNDNQIRRVIVDGIKNNGWIRSTFKSLEKCLRDKYNR